jgi:hypothetical protein
MIKFAKQGIIPQFILCFLTVIACILGILCQKGVVLQNHNSFVAQEFSSFFEEHKILNIISIFILLMLISLAFFVAETNKPSKYQNGFFRSFILGIMLFSIANTLTFNLLLIFFLAVCIYRKILQTQKDANSIYGVTLLISIASLLDFQLIWLQLVAVLLFFIYKMYQIRPVFLALIGIVLPYFYFYIALYYFTDISFVQILPEMKLSFNVTVLLLCFLPLSYIFSDILYKLKKNWAAEMIVILLIVMAIVTHIIWNII